MSRLLTLFLSLLVVLLPACREQSKEEIFQQGMTFVEAGNYQAAVTLFKDALDKDPNYIDARLQLGTAYQETNKLDKAEKELEKVLRQAPDNETVSLRLADIYLQTKRPDKAIRQLDPVLKKNPDNPEMLRILAVSHASKGDLVAAERMFRESLLAKPDQYQTQLGLSQLLYMTGRAAEGDFVVNGLIEREPKKTEAYYLLVRKALRAGNKEGAIASLERVYAIKSEDVLAAYMLGMLCLDVGRTEDAHRIASEILTLKPGHPAGYRIEGVALYQNGDYGAAVEMLQKSLNSMPDLPGFYFLGLANYRFNQLEQALSNFQKALDNSPGHEPSRLMVAQTLLKQGRTEDCIRQAELVIESNSLNADAYNILGSAFLTQRKYDQAMEMVETAIQINPNLAHAHLKKGLFNLAAGNNKAGEADIFNAINAAPEVLNTRMLLATYYLRQNNYPKALQILEEGLTISPDNALIYNFMAAAKFGQNKPEEAIRYLEKAKSLKPDFFSPYFNIANYYISRKEYQSALLEYQAVLQVDPGHLQALLKVASLNEFLNQNEEAELFYKRAAKSLQPQGYLSLTAFYVRSGKQDVALQTLKDAYTTDPDNPGLAVAYGGALKAAGQFEQAIQVYIHLEEIMPGTGRSLLMRTHLLRGDFASAQELADSVVSENPALAQGYLLQTEIHIKKAEWQLAEKVLKRGLAATGGSQELNIKLGQLYQSLKKNDNAMQIYNSMLRKNPDLIPALFAKAAIYDQEGDKKQAQAQYEKILTLNKDYAPALNNLSLILTDVYADHEKALKLAIRSFQLAPNEPGIIDTLGYTLLKNGHVEKSLVFLEKAASVMPEEVAIQIHLAQAYKAAGRNDDAVASLTAINATKAHQSQLREVEELLKELN